MDSSKGDGGSLMNILVESGDIVAAAWVLALEFMAVDATSLPELLSVLRQYAILIGEIVVSWMQKC